MRISTVGRFLGALCLAGSLTYAAAGSAIASTPRWSMTVDNLPTVVHTGNDAGFQVTISNRGPSNISQLYLVTGTDRSPDFVSTTQPSCSAADAGPLFCNFGALNAGASVTVTVAYPTSLADGDSFDPVFQASTTGVSSSDGGTSHGDNLTKLSPTSLTTSGDFAGGFFINGGDVHTTGDLNDSNRQNTDVLPPSSTDPLVVTAEDGSTVSFTCKKICSKAFGEWSAVNVNNGENFGDTYFPITLIMRASDAPNNLSQIKVAHVLNDGTIVVLDQCTTSVLENCIQVSSDGTIVQIKAWVNQNGGIRGIR